MKIAVDAMGGDNAPAVITDGVKLFREEHPDAEFILVGPRDILEKDLERAGLHNTQGISIQEADETILMGETPTKALRAKKNNTISVMVDLAKRGEADAILSAGNTGAVVAAATLKLRTLEGIDRPGIATMMPTPYGSNLLMDVGAVPECKAKNYLQFGIMGSCFSKHVLGVPNPTVGLLNIGEEESKGDDLTKEAHAALKDAPITFIGNVEGRDVFSQRANVIVTNGFIGNIVLKACESLAHSFFSVLKREILSTIKSKIGGWLLKGAFRRMRKQFDHEEYGGALLLGVNGVVIISHGSSTAYSIKNALRVASEMVHHRVNDEITRLLEAVHD